ncbi:GerAB/ArcD/ProY family transporter [Paenibacillus arenilitoris]|uniref:Endospore germination permease n=1 Tax=Paenibacillus arenilitoris TaxID=2772299 RepID=A0A927CNJ9_9BACL|nr:endospore germination permease [Paenibacillus arenilitoris]MBD2869858.1 endospore germination permease [Paenibacillus arenilitoris]
MNKDLISDRQFFMLIFVSITSLTYFSVPTMLVPAVKQDLWLSMVIGTVIDIYVAYLLAWLGRAYPGQSLVQYSVTILGKAGYALGFIFILFFAVVICLSLFIFSNFLSSTLLVGTPLIVLTSTMAVAAGWAAYNGIETIARLAEIISVLILLVSVAGVLISIPQLELSNLLPQLENGAWPAVKASVYPASWFGVCILMGMVMPHHNNPKRTFKLKASAVLLGASIMTLWLLNSIAALGQEVVGRLYYPVYAFTRTIQLVFLERVDILMMLVYISGTFITLSVLYYIAAEGAAQLFGTRSHRKWILPFGVLVTILPVLPPFGKNMLHTFKVFEFWFPLTALLVEGGLTTLLFVAALFRNRKKKPS